MNEWERLRRNAKNLRQRYPKGTVVCLTYMEGEPSMPSGLKGTVEFVDDIGQIHVSWENGRMLALNTEASDRFSVVSRSTKDKGELSR